MTPNEQIDQLEHDWEMSLDMMDGYRLRWEDANVENAKLREKLADMERRKNGWRRVALHWRGEWRMFACALIGRNYVNAFVCGRSMTFRRLRDQRPEQAGKE